MKVINIKKVKIALAIKKQELGYWYIQGANNENDIKKVKNSIEFCNKITENNSINAEDLNKLVEILDSLEKYDIDYEINDNIIEIY